MKSILAIALLCVATINLQAQTPTYDETVNYIINNIKGRVMYPGDLDAYNRVEGYRLEDVKIERNGKIELITNQQNKSYGYKNNFSIIFNIFDLVEKVDYPDGIRAHKFLVHFNGLNVSSGYGITFATDADAQKVARALRHLKTLCVKDDDLFSKIPDEEKKPKLSREETIDYINNLLYNLQRSQLLEYKNDFPKPPSSYLNNKPDYTLYWFPKFALKYSTESNKYTLTYCSSIQFHGLKNGEVVLYYAEQLKDRTSNLNLRNITGFEDDWDGVYESDGIKENYTSSYKFTKNFRYFKILFNGGGFTVIRYNSGDPKFTSRLKNALLRLKELEKDTVDPFDD